ncbi:LytR C-terminal domain-containing protein [Candidatus Woesebacteria bacterium]|nr:LytR C-terminal domain-containing protein [Candidatus Woesebacteria bacterium]
MASISKQTILASIAVVYMAASTFAAVRFYDLYKTYEAKVPVSDKEAEKETSMLVTQLKKIMEVPNETPVVATVKDKEALKSQQAFFAQAENGDKLIVFQTARKAVLFRPSVGKIVESGPLITTPTQQQPQTIKVAIYNGTSQSGAATKVEDSIKKAAGAQIITSVANAKSKDYAKTLVVDVTGNNAQSAADVAKFLGAEVSTLPAGEATPDADLLIIVGEK